MRRLIIIAVAALAMVGVLPAKAEASWWSCSTWVTRENGLYVGHLVCLGNPPTEAKYYYNKSSCKDGDGLTTVRRGVSVRIGSGKDSVTYCPKGTTLKRDGIRVGLRTKI